MSMEAYKGSALGSTEQMLARVQRRLFLAGGEQVAVPNHASEERPRIEMIPDLEYLQRRGPYIPTTVAGPRRLIAFCCTCQRTVIDLPNHVLKGHHDIRYMLLPDLRQGAT